MLNTPYYTKTHQIILKTLQIILKTLHIILNNYILYYNQSTPFYTNTPEKYFPPKIKDIQYSIFFPSSLQQGSKNIWLTPHTVSHTAEHTTYPKNRFPKLWSPGTGNCGRVLTASSVRSSPV